MEMLRRGLEVLGVKRNRSTESLAQGRQRIVYDYELGPSKTDKLLVVGLVGAVAVAISSTMLIDLSGGLEAIWDFISSADLSSPSSSGLPKPNDLLPPNSLSNSLFR